MKIIIRDLFRNYFPQYYQQYQLLAKEQYDSKLVEKRVKSHEQLNQGQVEVPEKVMLRRSSKSQQVYKNVQSNGLGLNEALLNRKSKDSHMNGKKSDAKHSEVSRQNDGSKDISHRQLSVNQRQKVRQVIPDRLMRQIQQFIQTHRFFTNKEQQHSHSTNFTLKQCLTTFQLTLLKCLPSTNLATAKPSTSRNPSHKTPHPTASPFIQQSLYKLSLYLNKETNRPIFTVYENILAANPRTGISYEALARKLKTDIINVSHYCCKLKKMRFVDWEHKKEGIVVFPKVTETVLKGNSVNGGKSAQSRALTTLPQLSDKNQSENVFSSFLDSENFCYSNSLLYSELTLNENILINMSSSFSLQRNGLTNEQIKFRIMKHAQNKMVRRTVESMKNVQKNAERQGKVFEFKYKRQSQRVVREMQLMQNKKRVENSGIISLSPHCRQYLNSKHSPQFNLIYTNQQLLQHLVNTKLTDYYSSIGIKQSKRQCTPLKLNRYIYILNYLQTSGPQTQLDLRRHIIDMEKELQSSQGIIHKRSVLGILEGLKKIQMIEEVEGEFWPKWCRVQRKEKRGQRQKLRREIRMGMDQSQEQDVSEDQQQGICNLRSRKGRKMQKRQNNSFKYGLNIPHGQIKMITKRQHLTQIFSQLLNFTLEKAFKRTFRRSFNRILYAQRRKQSLAYFAPEKNLFHLIDQQNQQIENNLINDHATTLQSFIEQISVFVQNNGKKLQNFPEIQYEVVKYVRRNPSKNADSLKSKYGKAWKDRFLELQKEHIIHVNDDGYRQCEQFEGFLV